MVASKRARAVSLRAYHRLQGAQRVDGLQRDVPPGNYNLSHDRSHDFLLAMLAVVTGVRLAVLTKAQLHTEVGVYSVDNLIENYRTEINRYMG